MLRSAGSTTHVPAIILLERPRIWKSDCQSHSLRMKSICNRIWMSWMRCDSQFKVYKVTIGQTCQMRTDSWMGMCSSNFAPRSATLLLTPSKISKALPLWSCWQWPVGYNRNVWICCCCVLNLKLSAFNASYGPLAVLLWSWPLLETRVCPPEVSTWSCHYQTLLEEQHREPAYLKLVTARGMSSFLVTLQKLFACRFHCVLTWNKMPRDIIL